MTAVDTYQSIGTVRAAPGSISSSTSRHQYWRDEIESLRLETLKFRADQQREREKSRTLENGKNK
jgi:hypothetical protein